MKKIPSRTMYAINRYVHDHVMPGGFLTDVLSNNLFGAVAQADSENLECLESICSYIWNEVPSEAWGNRKQVLEWVNSRI